MDMWAPYRDAVLQVLSDAKIVIDKFHVVKIERRIEQFGREMPDFAMEFAIDMDDQQVDEVNYGVDISTLTRMIESGEI